MYNIVRVVEYMKNTVLRNYLVENGQYEFTILSF